VRSNVRINYVESTPTLGTDAFEASDQMSDLATVNAGGAGAAPVVLRSLTVLDVSDQGKAFDILFFKSAPTIASSKNAALDIADAEMAKVVGVIHVADADFDDYGASCVASLRALDFALKPDADGNLYYVLVSQGTGTYAAAGLTLKFSFESSK
jgi:hypothetical protein